MNSAAGCALFAGLSEHKTAGNLNCNFIGERTQCPVGLLQLLPDRNVLRTVLLTFSAADALRGEGRLPRQTHGLNELGTTFAF